MPGAIGCIQHLNIIMTQWVLCDLTLLNIQIGQLAKSDPAAIHWLLDSINCQSLKKKNDIHWLLNIMELTDSLKKNDHWTVEYSFRPHMHQPQGTSTNNAKFSTPPLKKKKMKSARSLKEAPLRPASAKSHSSSPGSVSMEDFPPLPTAKLLPDAPHFPKCSCINCANLGEEDYCHQIIFYFGILIESKDWRC